MEILLSGVGHDDSIRLGVAPALTGVNRGYGLAGVHRSQATDQSSSSRAGLRRHRKRAPTDRPIAAISRDPGRLIGAIELSQYESLDSLWTRNMTQLTLRGFDPELGKRLREFARREGTSLNKAALQLMRHGAVLEAAARHG